MFDPGGDRADRFDELALAGDEPTAAAQRLRQGAHPDVHGVARQAEVFAHAVSADAENPERMRLVDHDAAVEFVGDLGDFRQQPDVPIHAVVALDDDQYPLEAVARHAQQVTQSVRVVVPKRQLPGPRPLPARHDAGVIQRIADQRVALTEQKADHPGVGEISAGADDGRVDVIDCGQAVFEVGVEVDPAGEYPARRGGGAVLSQRILGRANDPRGGWTTRDSCSWRSLSKSR